MNPQQPQSAPTPTPASPVPHHDPTRDELIEIGMLAIEDVNLAEGSAEPAIAGGPHPAAMAPIPAAAPQLLPPAPAPPTAVAPEPIPVPVPTPIPAVPDPVAPVPLPADEVPPVPPTTVVQPVAPLPAPDPTPPTPADPGPDAWDKAAAAALPVPPAAAPPKASGVPSVSPADIMEYSANSSQLKSISRLRKLSMLLYVVIIGLAIGIVVGGWYIYNMLGTSF